MIYGIVGSEQAKFTPDTELAAKVYIDFLLTKNDAVASGECHLGGIDIFAKEIALAKQIPYYPFPPKRLIWDGGYKQRNIQIAKKSDLIICITIEMLPSEYTGMRFTGCYHCGNLAPYHVKSGGCWTTKYARNVLHKPTKLVIIGKKIQEIDFPL